MVTKPIPTPQQLADALIGTTELKTELELELRRPPSHLDNFDEWLATNPPNGLLEQSIRDGRIAKEMAAELLLRAHWREDGWKFQAESYRENIEELHKLITQLIAMIQDSALKRAAQDKQRNLKLSVAQLKGKTGNQDRAKIQHELWRDAAVGKAVQLGYWDASELTSYIMTTYTPKKNNGKPYAQSYIIKTVRTFEPAYQAAVRKSKNGQA